MDNNPDQNLVFDHGETNQDDQQNPKQKFENSLQVEEDKNSKSKKDKQAPEKHWFRDNWALLSFLSMISFSSANLVIGTLAKLPGLQSVNYFCTGCIVFTIGYFIYHGECCKTNKAGAKDNKEESPRKVLTRTWDNKIDWAVGLYCIFSAAIQTCTYLSIMLCFRYSHRAGLNIGISQSIWALYPFMVALQDKCFYGIQIKCYQVAGMMLIVCCTILVSLSELFSDKAQDSVIDPEHSSPTYVAVLATLVMPVVTTFFANVIRYADVNLRLDPSDWTCAYMLIMSIAFQIVGIVNFSNGSVEFNLNLWIRGTFGSVLNCLGLIFLIGALNTPNAPYGPIGALVNLQSIVICVVEAVRNLTVPFWLQIVGMLIGIFGAMVLTIPDELYALWYRLTRCEKYQQPQSDPNDDVVSCSSYSQYAKMQH